VQIIDDSPDNLALMVDLLGTTCRTRVATSGERGLALVRQQPSDLVLLDVMMPGMDGLEVCRRLKEDPHTAHVPVIFLTTRDDEDLERRGLELGAVDFLRKPVHPPVFLARVRTHVALKRANDALRDQAERLELEVAQRTAEISTIQDVTILAMASLAETRDNETGNHIRRTQLYVQALAVQLRDHPRFRDELTTENIQLLYKSAPLHDIGKVGVPDHILRKPGRLTPDEFEEMKRHTIYGRDAILRAEELLGSQASFLRFAREIALSHQEKWDGSGYPEGLAGDAIPLSARLMAVADVYDALISKRVYKPAFPHDEAVRIITEGRGAHFDPDVVDAFLAIRHKVRAIAVKFADPDQGDP
jgi:putative two-component system response regulator